MGGRAAIYAHAWEEGGGGEPRVATNNVKRAGFNDTYFLKDV